MDVLNASYRVIGKTSVIHLKELGCELRYGNVRGRGVGFRQRTEQTAALSDL